MLATLLFSLLALAPLQNHGIDHHLVRILVRDAVTLDKVMKLDLDLAACNALELPAKEIEVIADDADVAKIKAAGLQYEVAIRNLEDSIEQRLSKYVFPNQLTPPVGQGGMGGNYTWAQIVAILDSLAKANPKIVSTKVSIGKSIEGRDLWMVKISDNVNVDEKEPEVLFDALHHAREPLSATTTLLFMDWLVSNYGKDPDATFLVDNREMYFVPCVNPDGYEYNRSIRPSGGGMWRKNRRNNGGGVYGVDLNRNWPTGWSAPHGGSSSNPSSETYRGTKALSEPEILALNNFVASRNFILGCSAHTYTDILLRPWGYQLAEPTNLADYQKIDRAATEANGIGYGAASKVLYIAPGTALDHYHSAYKMYGYSPELGRSNEGGFWPNPTNQVNIANRHQAMFRTLARLAGSIIEVARVSVVEGPGSNRNGRVDPGEVGHVTVELSNSGAAATQTAVSATLKSLSPGVVVVQATHNYGTIAKFSNASNSTSPLVIQVASTYQSQVAKAELSVTFDGTTIKTPVDLAFVNPSLIVADDFETDYGFARSSQDTATTGLFARGAPQQTTYNSSVIQPGSDHTANGTQCWVTDPRAGSSVGSYDVDGGKTSLLSPVLDLAHVAKPTLVAWIHYSESVSPGDPFQIDVSNDSGSTWKTIYSRTTSTNGWVRLELPFGIPATNKTVLRFSAQDLSPSLVEACVDDIEIRGVVSPADLTVWGSANRGQRVRVVLHGVPLALGIPLVATKTAALTIPGIEGTFLLDPLATTVLPGLAYGSSATTKFEIPIPNDSSFTGLTLYWQQVLVHSGTLAVGNRTSFRIQ